MEPNDHQPSNSELKADKKRQEKIEEQLNAEYTIKFKKREWIVIYNILVSQSYRLGDARIVNPICDRIMAIAALDTNIESKEGVITN